MVDTSLILHGPKNKSSAGNIAYSVSHDNHNICSQCGHDHNYKPIGGNAIQEMISFLDRDTAEKI